ncbi:MAG: hypothetical protein AAFY72_03975 [Cyanobacteria bacterium J06649_4]
MLLIGIVVVFDIGSRSYFNAPTQVSERRRPDVFFSCLNISAIAPIISSITRDNSVCR